MTPSRCRTSRSGLSNTRDGDRHPACEITALTVFLITSGGDAERVPVFEAGRMLLISYVMLKEKRTMTNRREFLKNVGLASAGLLLPAVPGSAKEVSGSSPKPNIVLIMTDDQGWGQTGYYNHPILKTPNLDAMAANGLRFDRFYAGAPVCSPTRASVLTGRANHRTGVPAHGYALRLQEKTLPAALRKAGYITGHFGKWHLNGLRGPGVPVMAEDSHNPGAFGFDEWLTVSNYFDINPRMSRKGTIEDFKGDSSEVIVREALKFIASSKKRRKPFLSIIWDGSPHKPWKASKEDRKAFSELNEKSQHHYGELVAFDRSIGVLRKGLQDLGIADNTLVWFCSDNGGLSRIEPDTVGGLRGNKGSIWEGGLRVPGIIEWPSRVKPRITKYPSSTMDIFPTIADILDLPESALLNPTDGISIVPLLTKKIEERNKPIPFRYKGKGALIQNDYKLVVTSIDKKQCELYNLNDNPRESRDISKNESEMFDRMKSIFFKWNEGVDASISGKDYPEGRVRDGEPKPRQWKNDERYWQFLKAKEKK